MMTDIEELSRELAKERERIVSECATRIQDVLKEYKCAIIAVPQIQDGKIVAVVQIVPM